MYQALYRKWRPLTFADVIGQQHITDTLRSQLVSGRLSHAYLFSGTRGTGKTTCAKILARAVNCEHPKNGDPCGQCASCRGILDGSVLDVVEIDAASNNGVDNIRDIREETRYAPSSVKKRVYIIDEVHMLSTGAFNALLKTLEEPPSHVLFILATTEIHKVPATILSRCQRFDFRRITPGDIARRLMDIAAAENIPLTEGGARLIARLADGAMRDALSMLDRTAGCETVDEEAVSRSIGILGAHDATGLMECIKDDDLAGAVQRIGEAYDGGRDLAGVFDQLLGLIRDMLLVKTAQSDVSAMLSPAYSSKEVHRLCEGVAASTLIAWSRILQESQGRLKTAANRRVEAELTVVRLCTMGGEAYDTLSGRVDALEEKVKYGVAVRPAAAPTQALPDDERPPLPRDDDAPPPPGDEDAPAWLEEEAAPSAQKKPSSGEKKAAPAGKPWEHWPKLLSALTGKINMGALTCMKAGYVRAEFSDGTLLLFCDDDITAGLLKAEPTQSKVREAAMNLHGGPLKLRVYEPGKKPKQKQENSEIDEVLQKAQSLDIEITELNGF